MSVGWEQTLEKLRVMQEVDLLCDCTVIGADYITTQAEYRAHSLILASSCQYLMDLIISTDLKTDEMLSIEGLNSDCIKTGLDFMYGVVPVNLAGIELLEEFATHFGLSSALAYTWGVRKDCGMSVPKVVRQSNRQVEGRVVQSLKMKESISASNSNAREQMSLVRELLLRGKLDEAQIQYVAKRGVKPTKTAVKRITREKKKMIRLKKQIMVQNAKNKFLKKEPKWRFLHPAPKEIKCPPLLKSNEGCFVLTSCFGESGFGNPKDGKSKSSQDHQEYNDSMMTPVHQIKQEKSYSTDMVTSNHGATVEVDVQENSLEHDQNGSSDDKHKENYEEHNYSITSPSQTKDHLVDGGQDEKTLVLSENRTTDGSNSSEDADVGISSLAEVLDLVSEDLVPDKKKSHGIVLESEFDSIKVSEGDYQLLNTQNLFASLTRGTQQLSPAHEPEHITQESTTDVEGTFLITGLFSESRFAPHEVTVPETRIIQRKRSLNYVTCPYCGFKPRLFWELRKHVKNHLKCRWKRNCPICDYCPTWDTPEGTNPERIKMVEHIIDHFDPPDVDEEVVKLTMKNKSNEQYLCEHCSRVFDNARNFFRHTQLCDKKSMISMLSCNLCRYIATTLRDIIHHLSEKHVGKKFFTCTICSQTRCRESTMVKHFCDDHGITVHSYMQLKFSKAALSTHTVKEHVKLCEMYEEMEGNGESVLFKDYFPCVQCNTIYTDEDDFIQHVAGHIDESEMEVRPLMVYQYECPVCGEMSKSSKLCNAHMIENHKEHVTGFSCDICQRIFLSKGTLDTHKLTHSTTRNYTCNICGNGFRFRQALNRHLKIMHEQSVSHPHECELCDYTTYCTRAMASHLNKHRKVRPYQCDLCDLAYGARSQLHKHKQIKHSGCSTNAVYIKNLDSMDEDSNM